MGAGRQPLLRSSHSWKEAGGGHIPYVRRGQHRSSSCRGCGPATSMKDSAATMGPGGGQSPAQTPRMSPEREEEGDMVEGAAGSSPICVPPLEGKTPPSVTGPGRAARKPPLMGRAGTPASARAAGHKPWPRAPLLWCHLRERAGERERGRPPVASRGQGVAARWGLRAPRSRLGKALSAED